MTVIKLTDRVETSYSGYKKLLEFYNICRDFTNQTIHIDFYELEWIDSNKSALLEAMLYKLNKENGLNFSTDFEFLKTKFDVLIRNGFVKTQEKIEDVQKSTIQSMNFKCTDKNGFVRYIENDLMKNRGMANIPEDLREKIIEDLIEVFCNAKHHANTEEPFFVAGQYYPKSATVKFTMVDLGDGFLPRINKATKGEITSSVDAIKWALEGNSSKLALERTSGGLGIKGMYEYCKSHNGQMDIITGDGYWSTTHKNTVFEGGRALQAPPFVGATINLVFQQ